MSSSTMISKPIDIYKNHLFYEGRTYLRQNQDEEDKIITRGASHHDAGAQPGDITVMHCDFPTSQTGKDTLNIFSPVSDADKASSDLTGYQETDQAILAGDGSRMYNVEPEYKVDKDSVTFEARVLDEGEAEPRKHPLRCDWTSNHDTVMGQPFEAYQVDDSNWMVIGVALIGHTSDSGDQKKEHMSLYKLSGESQAILEALSDKELDSVIKQFDK